jgi:hypothetical protein
LEETGLLDQALKLRKIRRVKRIIYVALLLLMVVLILLSLSHKGASTNPLFMPFPAILFIVIMTGMLLSIVAIVFNAVEITVADTPGQRFLTAKHGFVGAAITGVILIFLVILFALLIPWMEDYISTKEHETIDTSIVKTDDFFLVDDFDATFSEVLTLEAVQGAPLIFELYSKSTSSGDYELAEDGILEEGETLGIPLKDWPDGDYKIDLYTDGSPQSDETEFKYTIERKLNPELSTALVGLLGVIMVVNIVWAVIAFVLVRRYEVESVGGLATSIPLDEGY